MSRSHISLLVSAFAILMFYQNCAENNFRRASSNCEAPNCETDTFGDPTGNPSAKTEALILSGSEDYAKADILFVVDESGSMKKILQQVRDGFAAIAREGEDLPSNTRMAVTYMAPAFVKNGEPQFSKSYKGEKKTVITKAPGFTKLVSRQSISDFLDIHSGQSSNFAKSGCESEWFRPNERSEDGNLCLEGHIQVPYHPTGVEAGTVSLKQLIERFNSQSKALFREDAAANVIFVSDTHDPGSDNYYGKAKGASKKVGYDELTSLIHQNSQLRSLKFHSIAPLPTDPNSAHLDGVKVIGDLPKDKSRVTGEKVHDFKYLSFAKNSGGVAMSPVASTSQWLDAIREISKVAGEVEARRPQIQVSQPIHNIEGIILEGVLLQPENYEIDSDGRTIIFHLSNPPGPGDRWSVVIRYN